MGSLQSSEPQYNHWVVILDGPLDASDPERSLKKYHQHGGNIEIATQHSLTNVETISCSRNVNLTHLELEKFHRACVDREDCEDCEDCKDWCYRFYGALRVHIESRNMGTSTVYLVGIKTGSPESVCGEPASS